ncbi:MAG: tetratricopeptide repeat protein [Chloroflexota bacterium]
MENPEISQLEQAIAHLEVQREVLGEAVVETALAPLRERLATLMAQASSGQQRKQITVMFADISGYTEFSSSMDAEDVSELLNALWQQLDGVITRHGGRIDKHLGDGVMALWGAVVARENDPEQAIRAGLGMQQVLSGFSIQPAGWESKAAIHLTMRIGIHTGPAILGEVGSTHEFTAMGDTVNTANRIEQAAPAGAVLVSHETYRQARGLFEVQAQAPLLVKGKTEALRTYLVQRALPRSFRLTGRGIEGVRTRMVGREREMQALQHAFDMAMQQTQARLITVIGEAGVGKSRLLFEFGEWLEEAGRVAVRFQGRAYPETSNTPFSIFRDLFRERFNILDSDSAAVVRQKFETGVSAYLDTAQAHLVGHLVGFDFSSTTAVKNLIDSPSFGSLAQAYLSGYFQNFTAQEKALIFFEDIHWADSASLDLIVHLARDLGQRGVLIVCLARPALYERRPGWGEVGEPALLQRTSRLELSPLSQDDSRALVGEILQRVEHLPEDLCNLVVNSADGNPFYLEELVKMLIDDGVIVREELQWQVKMERFKQERVPSTLTGVIQARLDSLPLDEKVLLQRASVVGRLFWDATLACMQAEGEFPADETFFSITPALTAVQARELVFARPYSAFAGTREYIFKHAVLRDVTYETVLLKLRRVYHKQVAHWLEMNGGERLNEYAGLIAEHYERAGENSQAVDWLERVGRAASQTSSFAEAMSAFERALALVAQEDRGRRGALLVLFGNVFELMGDYPMAIARLQDGLALAREVRDAEVISEALCLLGSIHIWTGDYAQAQQLLEEALVQSAGIKPLYAQALRHMGSVYYSYGDREAAIRHYQDSLAIYREIGDRHGVAGALNNLGLVCMLDGDYENARQYGQDCLAIDRELGDRRGISISLLNLGVACLWQGDPAAARPYLEESLALCQEINNLEGVATCYNVLGHITRMLGEEATSRQYYLQSLVDVSAIGAIPRVLNALAGLAGLQAMRGETIQAAELLGLALRHPASDINNAKDAEPILADLRAVMTDEELETAMERGKHLDLETVVAQILAEAQA